MKEVVIWKSKRKYEPKAPKSTATVCAKVRRMLSAYLGRSKG